MPELMTRAQARAARTSRTDQIDPTLAAVLDDILSGTPADQQASAQSAVGAFCAWIEREGQEFSGYDEAFQAYSRAVEGTPAAATLPHVQLLLVALDERTGHEHASARRRGAHAA